MVREALCSVIMEYADDGDLYQKIVDKKKRNELFSEEEIWRVLIQVTRGLKALHALNIFHRDLKVHSVRFSQPMYFSPKKERPSWAT